MSDDPIGDKNIRRAAADPVVTLDDLLDQLAAWLRYLESEARQQLTEPPTLGDWRRASGNRRLHMADRPPAPERFSIRYAIPLNQAVDTALAAAMERLRSS